MYNLLVTARVGAWDSLSYELERSRFLEYTNETLAEKFQVLGKDQIEYLKIIPCLFAYEGFNGNARVGRLTEIKERGSNLFITYEFHPKIKPISHEKIHDISLQLDIRNWEMNRTHWAIKDESLFARLKTAGLVSQKTKEWPPSRARTQQPPEANSQASRVSSVAEFIAAVLAKTENNGAEIFYRGHSDKQKYKLEPSLFRKDASGNYMHLHNEHFLYRELIVSNAEDFDADHYTLDRLVRMQHYSLPTRLLDITSNPLIALYFACKPKSGAIEHDRLEKEVEGEVIVFAISRHHIKYFDSDKASCIANLVRLPKEDKEAIDFNLTLEAGFNKQQPIRRLTHFIKEEKSFFEPNIVPSDLKDIICVKGKKNNARIYSQSGAFLLFGLDAVLNENGSDNIKVTRISVSNKTAILAELDKLNINESTVFPYIESSAKYFANKYKFIVPK